MFELHGYFPLILQGMRLTVAVALLFVPLLDTALAILRRKLHGDGLMTADRGHVPAQGREHLQRDWQLLAAQHS